MQAERSVKPQNPPAQGRAGAPEAEASPDAAAPSTRGPRHKVPLLNLSTESLRLSVEAMTPPCSFPLRAQVSSSQALSAVRPVTFKVSELYHHVIHAAVSTSCCKESAKLSVLEQLHTAATRPHNFATQCHPFAAPCMCQWLASGSS